MGKYESFFTGLTELWKNFLDSLATRGGTIFVLFVLVLLSGVFVLHVLHHAPTNQEAMSQEFTLASGALTGFTSALTLALTGGNRMANGKNDTNKEEK